QAQNVRLDAEVVSDDVILGLGRSGVPLAQLPGTLRPFALVLDGSNASQVVARHAGEFAGEFQGAFGIVANKNAGALGTLFADDARELAGVDAGNGNHTFAFEVFRQRLGGAEVRYPQGAITYHQARGMNTVRFDVFFVEIGRAHV